MGSIAVEALRLASMEPHSGSAVKRRAWYGHREKVGFNGAALWERGETY